MTGRSCRSPYGCLAPGDGCPTPCPITDKEEAEMNDAIERDAAAGLPLCNLRICPEPGEHRITTGRCLLVPPPGTPEQLGRVDRGTRDQLQQLFLEHWRTATSGCGCGRIGLGESWTRHLADVVRAALTGPEMLDRVVTDLLESGALTPDSSGTPDGYYVAGDDVPHLVEVILESAAGRP